MCILQLFNVVENLPLIHVVRVWQHPLEVLAHLLYHLCHHLIMYDISPECVNPLVKSSDILSDGKHFIYQLHPFMFDKFTVHILEKRKKY